MNDRPNIFVGIDPSWRNSGALDWALRESHLRGQPIRAVHVIEDKMPFGPESTAPSVERAAKRLVADVADYLADHDEAIGHSTDILTGRPAAKLGTAAANAGASMLVVGRMGSGRLARLLIGSTAEAITHLAELPVVVVPDAWNPHHPGAPVVVGVDESEEDNAALAFAATAAVQREAPLRLVRVWDLPGMYSWDAASVTDLYDGWFDQSDKRLQAIADKWRVKYPQLDIHAETRRGTRSPA